MKYFLVIFIFLSSCGFHLRGSNSNYKLAFKDVKLECNNVAICSNLINLITTQNLTTFNDNSNTIIKVIDEKTSRDAQGFNSIGRISNYILTYQVRAQVWLNNHQIGQDIVVRVQDNMQYNDSIVLASNNDEAKFWDNLHINASNQLIERLVFLKK